MFQLMRNKLKLILDMIINQFFLIDVKIEINTCKQLSKHGSRIKMKYTKN